MINNLKLSVCRVLCLAIVATATATYAQFTFTTNNGVLSVASYTGLGGDVVIPVKTNGLPVVAIGPSAFCSMSSLSSVTIPSSVTNIGDNAFIWCDGLAAVSIGDSVTRIGDFAFYGCFGLVDVTIGAGTAYIGEQAFGQCSALNSIDVGSLNARYCSLDGVLHTKDQATLILYPTGRTGSYVISNTVAVIADFAFSACFNLTNVTIPNSVSSLGNDAFSFSRLRSVSIPNSVTNIGSRAFYGCSMLPSVLIPASVASIGNAAFAYCAKLTSIDVDASNPSYSGSNGVLFSKDHSDLLQYPRGKLGDYEIPNSVSSIEPQAFYYCTGITNVTIPGSVTNIGDRAFRACSKLIAISVDLQNVNYASMDGVLFNKSFTTLIQYPSGKRGSYTIPSGVVCIADRAFAASPYLTDVTIPDSVHSIGDSAFNFCDFLASVSIPYSVTNIGAYAFCWCNSLGAIGVSYSNSNYSSHDGVLFTKNQSTLIQYPGGKAGDYAIPATVTSIGVSAFDSCSMLTGVTIPASVASIRDSAFSSCDFLTELTIPGSVTNVEDYAFSYCYSLQSVFFGGSAPLATAAAFSVSPTTCYYLPGKRGWGNAYAGRPATLWDPMPQSTGAGFGIGPNGFGFDITGTAGIPFVVEASDNLTGGNWLALMSCSLTNGQVHFTDPAWSIYPSRLYRIRSP